MLTLLFLFLSFAQVGFFGIGGDTSTQAVLEHEVITLHDWLTPAQFADIAAFCNIFPGGNALNISTLCGYTAMIDKTGFGEAIGGSLIAVIGLVFPSFIWTFFIIRFYKKFIHNDLIKVVMKLLHHLVPGLIVGASLLLMRTDIFSSVNTSPWQFGVCLFLFISTLIGVGIYHFKGGFMIIICGIAGYILL